MVDIFLVGSNLREYVQVIRWASALAAELDIVSWHALHVSQRLLVDASRLS